MSYLNPRNSSLLPFVELEDFERKDDPANPCRALYAAVLEQAVIDYTHAVCHLAMVKGEMGDRYHSSFLEWKKRSYLKEIPKYFNSDSLEFLSFIWMCEAVAGDKADDLAQKLKKKLVELNNSVLRVTELKEYL